MSIKEYFRFPSKAPYAWAVYLFIALFAEIFVRNCFSSQRKTFLVAFSIAVLIQFFVTQSIVNGFRLSQQKNLQFNLKKIIINTVLFYLIWMVNFSYLYPLFKRFCS